MENSLDMSLDDLIKTRSSSERRRGRGRFRQGRGRGRGRGGIFNRGWGTGMLRRGPLRVNAQPLVNVIAKPSSRTNVVSWQHDLFQDSLVAAGYTGAKLYVSNLDYGVTNEDIKELFSEVGELKRYTLHYDRNGLSSGTAEVVFTRRTDALAAMKRYNNVQLDGKAMKIEIIGAGVGMPISAELGLPVSARVNVMGGSNGRGRRAVVMMALHDGDQLHADRYGLVKGSKLECGDEAGMGSWVEANREKPRYPREKRELQSHIRKSWQESTYLQHQM